MGSNSFGTLFRITTWGESHGKAIGVVIDGCPAGLPISDEEINAELSLRQGGKSSYVTPRKEKDEAQIYSGVFEGKTTGAPISIIIFNHDADPGKYEPIKDLLRPGHANFTYLEKYGIFDYRGGGRSSARETACRVAAGAVAKKLLAHFGIDVISYVKEIGGIAVPEPTYDSPANFRKAVQESILFCPDSSATQKMIHALEKSQEEGDSLGGIIETIAFSLPIGLGDPVYEKLEANLGRAFLSIPATKGFEIGSGFAAARMKGSEHNDPCIIDDKGNVSTATNFAGGTLGGISTGLPLIARVAFKPTSSIKKIQMTLNLKKEEKEFKLPEGSRHDPCVTIRAVPIVEAMAAIVIADALLMGKSSRL
jgi:chorismate synthase